VSDSEFWTYTGLLGVSGLVLLVLCTAGLGQSGFLRGVEALFGFAFLGYAGYLGITQPSSPFTFYYGFALPVLALIYAGFCWRRVVKLRRLAAKFVPDPYAGQAADAHTERQPFPQAPSPLAPGQEPGSPAARPQQTPAPPPSPAPEVRPPMPSGLPERPEPAQPRPGRPSGLPHVPRGGDEDDYTGRHAEGAAPGLDTQRPSARFPHGAAYPASAYENRPSGGRHRAADSDESSSR
jgi:hypothetical protein